MLLNCWIHDQPAGMPSGLVTCPSTPSKVAASSIPVRAIVRSASANSHPIGRQRRDGRRPSGKSSSGQVTSAIRPTKLQFSSQAAQSLSGRVVPGSPSHVVANIHTAPRTPPSNNASPSRCPGRLATTSAPNAAQFAVANPSPTIART